MKFDKLDIDEESPLVNTEKKYKAQYLKIMVFSGIDGIISVFIAVAVLFTNIDIKLILAIALTKLLSGSISFGIGDWISRQLFINFAKEKRSELERNSKLYLESDRRNLIKSYENKGMSSEDAASFVDLLMKNQNGFVNILLIEKFGISENAELQNPLKNGLVNFGSFILFGFIPIIPFIIFAVLYHYQSKFENNLIPFFISGLLFLIVLGLLGFFKAKINTSSCFTSILITLGSGILSAILACIFGYFLYKNSGITPN